MKFNKHISLFLALFLLVSNLGLSFNVHYCGEKISSIAPVYMTPVVVTQKVEKDCCGAMLEKKKSCCNDKVVVIQKKAENVIIKAFTFSTINQLMLSDWSPIIFTKKYFFKNNRAVAYFCDAHAPPFFKLYKQYIFYA